MGMRVCRIVVDGSQGSIPEKEEKTDSIYNCATAYDPQGECLHSYQTSFRQAHAVGWEKARWSPSTGKSISSISISRASRLSRSDEPSLQNRRS